MLLYICITESVERLCLYMIISLNGKIFINITVVICLLSFSGNYAMAKHIGGCPSHNHHHNGYNHNHSSGGSSSTPIVLTNTKQEINEIKFPNCKEHYAIREITTEFYSNGTKKVYTNYTVYDSEGAVLAENCKSLEHIIYNGKHYFVLENSNGYQLTNGDIEPITTKKYSKMQELKENRLLVKYNDNSGVFSKGKYGVIDLEENVIIPTKYDELNYQNNGVFISKLNGYYGIIDTDNNELIKNDCDSVKNIHNLLLLKKYGKYGLATREGKVISGTNYDKIKKLGEYISVKKNDKYGILDANGNYISEIIYTAVKIDRNTLFGKTRNGIWVEIKLD